MGWRGDRVVGVTEPPNTEALLATVREGLGGIPFRLRALDAIASELERLTNKLNTDSQNFELEARKAQIAALEAELERAKANERHLTNLLSWREKERNTAQTELAAARMGEGEAMAELERVRAERDAIILPLKEQAEARLDRAVEALREIEAGGAPAAGDRRQNIARAALAEIQREETQ
jgi:chromosome segregation ATPase